MDLATRGISWVERVYYKCEDIYKDGIMVKETGKIVDVVSEKLRRVYDEVADDLLNPFSFVDDSILEDDPTSPSSSSSSSPPSLSSSSSSPSLSSGSSSSSSLSSVSSGSSSSSSLPSPRPSSSFSSLSSLISLQLPSIPLPPPPPSSTSISTLSLLLLPPPLPSPSSTSMLSSSSPATPSSSSDSKEPSPPLSSPPTPTSSGKQIAIDSCSHLQDKQEDDHIVYDKNARLTGASIISNEIKVNAKVNRARTAFDPNYFASKELSQPYPTMSREEKFIKEKENGEDGEFDEVCLEDFDERKSYLDEMEEVDRRELALISQRAMKKHSYKKKLRDLFTSNLYSARRKRGSQLGGVSVLDAIIEEKYMRETSETSAQGLSPARGSSSSDSDWELV